MIAIGVIVAVAFVAVGAFFDLKSRGEFIPDLFLLAWGVAGGAYLAYTALFTFSASEWFWLRGLYLVTVFASFLMAIALWRLRLAAVTDCIGLCATTALVPFLAIVAFIVAAAAHAVFFGSFVFAVNVRRSEKGLPLSSYPFSMRLTPRLKRLPFAWYKTHSEGKLVLFPNVETVPLDAEVGDFAAPFKPFLPFYLLALVALCLVPEFAGWLFGINSIEFQWMLQMFP